MKMIHVTITQDSCKGCGLCVEACPKSVIALDTSVMNVQGYHPAAVTAPAECIGCCSCAVMCPDSCIEITAD